jgi:hypothetical protein
LLYQKDTLLSIVPISKTNFDLFDGEEKKIILNDVKCRDLSKCLIFINLGIVFGAFLVS